MKSLDEEKFWRWFLNKRAEIGNVLTVEELDARMAKLEASSQAANDEMHALLAALKKMDPTRYQEMLTELREKQVEFDRLAAQARLVPPEPEEKM